MQNETMTATEAWEAVERHKIAVDYNREHKDWSAMVIDPEVDVACGYTSPIAAVEALVLKIAKRATNAEARRKIEARLVEPLNKMSEQLKRAEAALTN
jgi:hypothetical protein